MSTPRTQHENYMVKARERFGTCSPYRLGMVIGEDGADLPSPYQANSRGDKLYREGLELGKKKRAEALR